MTFCFHQSFRHNPQGQDILLGREADRGRAGEGGEVGAATQWGFLEVATPQRSGCHGKKVWKRHSRQGLGISEMTASSELGNEEVWAGAGRRWSQS